MQSINIDIIDILVRLRVDLNVRCSLGNTALHYAMMIGDQIPQNIDIIETLIAAGANYRVTNNYNQTPLFFASKRLLATSGLLKKIVMKINKDDYNDLEKMRLDPEIEEVL